MATNIGTLMIGVRGDVAALHADVQSLSVIVRRGFDQMGADMRRAEQAGRQFNEQMRNASMSLRGLVAEAAGLAGLVDEGERREVGVDAVDQFAGGLSLGGDQQQPCDEEQQ